MSRVRIPETFPSGEWSAELDGFEAAKEKERRTARSLAEGATDRVIALGRFHPGQNAAGAQGGIQPWILDPELVTFNTDHGAISRPAAGDLPEAKLISLGRTFGCMEGTMEIREPPCGLAFLEQARTSGGEFRMP